MPLNSGSTSRADDVVRAIERSIRDRGLGPGDRLATKGDLQEAFGVARATINEAIKLLLDRGRITAKPGPKGGLFVAETTPTVQLGRVLVALGEEPERVAEAIELHDYLQPWILQEAVMHRSPEDVHELRLLLLDLTESCGHQKRFFDAGLAFHRRIGVITPNEILKNTYCGLIDFTKKRASAMAKPPEGDLATYHQSRVRIHEDMLDIIEQGDLSRVGEVIEAHYGAWKAQYGTTYGPVTRNASYTN